MKTNLLIMFMLCLSLVGRSQTKSDYNLDFDIKKYKTQTLEYKNKKINVRAYEGIVYVSKPIDTVYESMNIYIPEEYFNGKSINDYTVETAPIFFPNQVGGYMPATAASTTEQTIPGMPQMMPMPEGFNPDMAPNTDNKDSGKRRMPREMPEGGISKENTVIAALARGYIVASAGARGRTNENTTDGYYGKAPAAIVDLKAALRYLRYNDKVMPGDANKIITNGTSAGGAMSSLLGATGNHPDYLPYLKQIGAAEASDAVYATSAYCPITNLDHADMAYEWQFNGVNTYTPRAFGPQSSQKVESLTSEQVKISNELKALFPNYLNSLQLRDEKGSLFTLDNSGNGNFKDYIKSVVIESANKAISEGKDLSKHSWLKFKNGLVVDLNWTDYINYMTRLKTPPAFDALDLSSPENNLFGTSKINNQHFTLFSAEKGEHKDLMADSSIIKLMNPMYYIKDNQAKVAKHWRIRHGAKDSDGGLAISAMLTTLLRNNGNSVDYALPWDTKHSGDYDLDELFAWIDSICK